MFITLFTNTFRTASASSWAILIFCVSFHFFSPHTATGQLSQPNRFEQNQKSSDAYFHVISLKEQGIALFRERDKYKESNKVWELIFLDTTLHERKVVELNIKERFHFVGYEVTATHLFLLYRTGENAKNDFDLYTVNLNGEEEARHTIKSDLDFKLTHFILADNSFVLGGYVNKEPAMLVYNLITKNIKVLPGFFQKDTELIDLRLNQNNTFNVVMMDRSGRSERTLLFKTFDSSGELLLEDVIPIDENKSLQTGIVSTLEREDLIILGSWGDRNAKTSLGFYAVSVDPFDDQKINFIPFGLLTHYLDYLKPKRASKIIESTKADVQAGRNPNFTSTVTPYKIVEHKDGFLLLAEVYTAVSSPNNYSNPYYNNNPYYYNPYSLYPYGFNNYPSSSRMYRPYPYSSGSNNQNSKEVKIHETVLISFDPKGQVVWDQSLVLDDLRVEAAEQATDFTLVDGQTVFLYKKESELKWKTISETESTSIEQTEKIKTNNPLDEIRSERDTDGFVRYWYGHSFFVWGYQTIRNLNSEERVRDVFYINKVVAK